MTKKLKVTATHIHCLDPQDPFTDELYFITGCKETSLTSETTRRIKRGFNEEVKIKLLDTKFDETQITPVQVTLWEQRALRDNGKAAEMLESISKQAVQFSNDHLKGLSRPELVVQVSSWLLENATSFFKRIFRDTPLGTAEITIPRPGQKDEKRDFPEKIDGKHHYHLTAKGDKGSTYLYEIDLLVEIE